MSIVRQRQNNFFCFRTKKTDILGGYNLHCIWVQESCLWRFGKLVEIEAGWRLMPKFGTGRQLSKSEISSWSSCWWRLRSTNSTLEFAVKQWLEGRFAMMGRALDKERSIERTKTNNSKRVPTNPCATEGGIFQLFRACDLLPLLHLHIRKGSQEWIAWKNTRSVVARMLVTNEDDTDHVGQPVGPSVKVEDKTQCCVSHLKVAMWLGK